MLAIAVLYLALWPQAARAMSAQDDCPRAMLPAYSHNDYEQARPLRDALALGFRGVEVDVFMIDGVLRVGHDRRSASRGGSLETMYLVPLDSLARRCARLTVDEQPYLLLLELKERGQAARDSLAAALQRYPRLAGSGKRATVEAVFVGPHQPALHGYRGGEFDLHRHVGSTSPPGAARLAAHRSARLLSLNYGKTIGRRWRSARERRRQLETLGSVSRDTPGVFLRAHNVPLDSAIYSQLLAAGVDLIGTKQLAATSSLLRKVCTCGAGCACGNR